MEKGVKSRAHQDLTAAHHGLQKPASLAGISRTYQPKDEEGEQLPPESTLVQVRAEDVLRDTARALTRLFDVTATEDWANCDARADITVDGRVLVEATDKHPAQVEVSCEDVPVGYRTTVKFSDALPARRVNEPLERVEKLQQAAPFAREEANGAEATDQRVGDAASATSLRVAGTPRTPRPRRAAGVREERKAEAESCRDIRGSSGGSSPPPAHFPPGWPDQAEADRGQSQAIAPDSACAAHRRIDRARAPRVEMPVRIWSAELDRRWSEGRTRRIDE